MKSACSFTELEGVYTDPERAQVVILPVPFEQTSTYGCGSAHGPQAILDASQELELFDTVLGCEPYLATQGIATLPPLQVEQLDGESLAEALFQEVLGWLQRGKYVVVLGGEHTSVVGSICAHCAQYDDLTVLQLDAHSDLRQTYQGSVWNHACAMARVFDFHDHLVQVGIRSQTGEERAYAKGKEVPVFYAHTLGDAENASWIDDVVAATRPNVYITLDCDVMDPTLMPATGTPEPDGLQWRQLNALLVRLCEQRNVVGLDINELAPITGLHHPQFTVAKLLYRFLGYRFCE